MPSKYVIREFTEGGIYHAYNRGVEKRTIFLDEQDYNIFLYYIFIYLAPSETVLSKYPTLPLRLQGKNLAAEVDLFCYCLMPNHFHLLVQQKTIDGISKFIKQLTNAYTLYFNQKYQRVGSLMQGPFKAIMISTENSLLHISRYIHLNPIVNSLVTNLKNYQWSSFKTYIANSEEIPIKKNLILSFFSSSKDYERFVLDQVDYAKNLALLKEITIEELEE